MQTISLLDPLRRQRLAFLDVETTGTSPRFADRVTEVGIRLYEGGVVSDDYQQLINPQRRIPQSIVQLTGITQEMADAAPTFEDVYSDVARRLEGAVVIGHNVRFDLGFIKAEFDRTPTRFDQLVDCSKVIDTVRLARRTFGRRGNGLQRLAARLDIRVETAHRALADCITTAAIFERMIAPHGGWDLSLADLIALQGGAAKYFGAAAAEPLPIELEDALRLRRHVRMIYLDTRNNRSERIVVPIEVRMVGKHRCVAAFCTLKQERRYFQLHRIVHLTPIETLYDDIPIDLPVIDDVPTLDVERAIDAEGPERAGASKSR